MVLSYFIISLISGNFEVSYTTKPSILPETKSKESFFVRQFIHGQVSFPVYFSI